MVLFLCPRISSRRFHSWKHTRFHIRSRDRYSCSPKLVCTDAYGRRRSVCVSTAHDISAQMMGTLPARCGCAADERRTSSAQKRARALLRPPHASGPGERCWVRSGRGADVAEGERNRNQRVFPCSINTLVPSFKLLGAALKFLLQCHDRALAFLELLLEIFQLQLCLLVGYSLVNQLVPPYAVSASGIGGSWTAGSIPANACALR